MIPEIGHFALLLALILAGFQSVLPFIGIWNGNQGLVNTARPLAWGQLFFIALAFACLTAAFLLNDFSVYYVANNSNTLLPLIYKISGVWAAHEGSLLLWVLMLTGWGAAVAAFSHSIPDDMVARILAVLGLVGFGFMLFLELTSNPFMRLILTPENGVIQIPTEGHDLNPLLQDPGLAVHPPLLYMGYVGFSVAFACAIAALISGRSDALWARWSRPWTLMAWIMLTLGIVLGSWWAYNELGWGGWWFWDPVENASLMPWLLGTALLHSLAVTEKRGAFRNWTLLLAISAFSFCLLGTFLVRSGVITSVHAFAADPYRGNFILVYLVLVVGISLTLYALRSHKLPRGGQFELFSRETFLLINNLMLTVLTAVVLLGTIAPLIYEAANWGRISVGFPWFNRMFSYLGPLLLIAVGIGPLLRWKKDSFKRLRRNLVIAIATTLVVVVLVYLFVPVPDDNAGSTHLPFGLVLGIALVAWVATTLLISLAEAKGKASGLGKVLAHYLKLPRSFWGMWLAHAGLAVLVLGVIVVSYYDIETDLRMAPNASHTLHDYRFEFLGVHAYEGPNYTGFRGTFNIYSKDRKIAQLFPEKRSYLSGGMPMTEAAIAPRLTSDIYVALGEPVENQGDWSVRLYYKPFVRWIWLGGILMAIGGFLATSDKRYRFAHLKNQTQASA